MKEKQLFSMAAVLFLVVMVFLMACSKRTAQQPAQVQAADSEVSSVPVQNSIPRVYFTTNISQAGLIAVYEALGLEATGNVAIKVHTGEPGNKHFVSPELMRSLVQRVNSTFVETNVAYGGRRASTAMHMQVARDHGFAAVAPVVILDERAGDDISFPVIGGKRLTENIVGGRFNDFDFHIVVSHFKGHQMGGFGGALKNLSIGYASAAGKSWIHSAGQTRGVPLSRWNWDQNAFLESMAESAKTITDRTQGKILYINVMNHLSIDCDCNGNPSAPTMADIGILASLDPVALDQACIDLVYAAPESKKLIDRIESMNGLLTIEYAEKLGIGSRKYELIKL